MLSFTPSDSGSSGTTSRDEPSLFDIPPPLFGPGPRRPSKSIRETRQNSQPFWPRTPSSSSSSLPQASRPGVDDVFRSDVWRRSDASTPASTRPPSQASLHIWTPPRTDSRHGLHPSLMSPLSQYSSDRSTTTTSHPTPITPVGPLPPQYPRHTHSHSTTCVPQASPDNTPSGHYYAAPPLQSRSTWSPSGAVPRDFQIATSKPIRITTPDGKPVTLPERKSSSSSPIKAGRTR
ncbi:hypothetical protein B0J17DRAFT_718683 [Rhizoctonia solani]|nr:hypothetical protein B0J17DRAFT_718683 [Rhizoctonia solani]